MPPCPRCSVPSWDTGGPLPNGCLAAVPVLNSQASRRPREPVLVPGAPAAVYGSPQRPRDAGMLDAPTITHLELRLLGHH
jgi:hypothetical protein